MEQIETIGATEQRELTRIRISVRNLVEFIFVPEILTIVLEKVHRKRLCRKAAGCTVKSRDEWEWNIEQRFL